MPNPPEFPIESEATMDTYVKEETDVEQDTDGEEAAVREKVTVVAGQNDTVIVEQMDTDVVEEEKTIMMLRKRTPTSNFFLKLNSLPSISNILPCSCSLPIKALQLQIMHKIRPFQVALKYTHQLYFPSKPSTTSFTKPPKQNRISTPDFES